MSQMMYLFLCNSYNFTLFCKSTLAPCCSNTLTTSTCPFRDAIIRGVHLSCPNISIALLAVSQPYQYILCKNLPLLLYQHILYSALKCLPPQHFHSQMPRTVQSPHSVKTICTLSTWKLNFTKNEFNHVLVGNPQH